MTKQLVEILVQLGSSLWYWVSVIGIRFVVVFPELTLEMRQQMVDEIMYQIARLLPPEYRGYYADLSAATETYLRFLPG